MRRNRLLRLWAAWIALVAVLGFIAPTAAFAGTLTSATFTTAGTGYAATSAQNTRYDWNYTTASSLTLSRVSQTVPAGTNSYNPRYLSLPGTTANYAATPDSVANSVTGDIDLRVKVAMNSWTPASQQALITKWVDSTQCSFAFILGSSGTLNLFVSPDGHSGSAQASTVAVGATNGQSVWVRVTFQANNGSNQSVYTFYTSADGVTWTQLGPVRTTAVTSIFDGTAPIALGMYDTGTAGQLAGKIYSAEERNGINGPVVAGFYPTDDSVGGSSWTSSSPQAETWTITRTGTNLPADIASDLTVSNVSGLPPGGTASYRMIDGAAVYVLPTATAVAASTPCSIGLTGFTNTSTAGSYTSTITTYDNSATPVSVDSATTGTLTFAPASNTTAVSATIDPTFTFTVANQATACNGESNFVSAGGSATGVALGHVSSSANVSAGQALTVASNAGGGFNVYIRGTQATQNLRSSSRNWTDVTGTYASPAALGAGEAFGYTYKDSTSSTSVTNPASAMFAALTGTNQAVMGSASSSNGNSCVSFDAQTAPTTPAGTYSATIVYIALPSF